MQKLFQFSLLAMTAMVLSFGAHQPAQAQGVDRPFKGYAVAVSNAFVLDNPAPGLFEPENPNGLPVLGYFDIQYEGRATHLGKMTRQEYAVLYADGSFEGLMIFVAANGDELYATLDGSLNSLVPPADGSGRYYFFGGTGRFEDATGTTCFELFTPDFNDVYVTFDGIINF